MPALHQEQLALRDQQVDTDDAHAHDVEDELPEAYCGGCGRLIDEESVEEGVIQFATKLWHVECFRCAKCKNRVSTERDDILLLSDGHPICGQCNYSCNICNLPIMEEAIMTGDESYHASCFTCRSCHSKIEELVFAKTSQGIYCMKCHNERVARSRKHAEQKRAKARREKQLQDAHAAELNQRNNLATPTLDQPLSLPSKQSPLASPSPSVLASPAPNASSLSPCISQAGSAGAAAAVARPNSANGKRPMNAPPPPSREGRSPAMGTHAKLEGRSVSANNTSRADSRTSLSSNTADDQLQPQNSEYEVTAPLSPRKKAFAAGSSSPLGSPAAAKTMLPAGEAPTSPSSPTTSPLKKSVPMDGSPRADVARSLRPSTSREGLGVNLRTSSIKPGAGARNPLNASGSSSRLSKVYSFYDPDFLNLVESFGDFGSTDELHSPAPPVPALPTSVPAVPAVPATSKDVSPSSSTDLPTSVPLHPHGLESSAAPSASTSASEIEADDRQASAPPHHISSDLAESVESEEELLDDDRRNTITSTGSLKEVSSKVRASMQQARDGQVSMDISFVETILHDLEQTRQRMESLQLRYDRIRRASQQAAHGFSMAKEEFEHEVNARHDAELEMARLRRQLAEQALKLATANSERRQQEQLERRSQDVKASLKGMERDLAKLTVERDLTVAEVAELVALQDGTASSTSRTAAVSASSATGTVDAAITQNLTSRLEAVKSRYRNEIDELTIERDSLLIEIEELKQSKELFLEEAQSLNAKNDELNTMLGQLNRKIELAAQSRDQLPPLPPLPKDLSSTSAKSSGGFSFGSRHRHVHKHTAHSASISSHDAPPSSAGYDTVSVDTAVQQVIKPGRVEPAPAVKKFKWMKPKLSETTRANQPASQAGAVPPVPPKSGAALGAGAGTAAMTRATSHDVVVREHLFQPFNVLRPTRCFACQKNMWGQSEMRCALCAHVCHSRCLQSLPVSCNQPYTRPDEAHAENTGPSMFGRSLTEQAAHEGRDVPLIVDKCIQAVEAFGMDYEGIYRKSGGTSQLKVITQLFERGNAFDLEDTDRFNDVSAITSVLKNYFRELPTPLLTFELYDELIKVVESKTEDVAGKLGLVKQLVDRLPRQHFCTLQHLVLHLYRVQERSADNRMNARNLGVVFGPTLMRSADPTQEFAHMGGKAMTVEFFIDHAPELFV
ncbi:related to GTPase-activating protein beta-chimerin [Sporisorium reilianum f. sp. reilianum]|uniref:Related to GTPase-activating protein beta-chimerin n=1 Tax=Sporisorium reilianum f. sp. reilianum TaxID=72559 RepID=A0A2N8UGZ3_9BASI|nr:related to GTPase-activating protein beta-chimerin [Sporisorium reilianum f. sp. reilianum]